MAPPSDPRSSPSKGAAPRPRAGASAAAPADAAALEDVARRFHEHQLGAPLSLLVDLMCEDAEMVLFANLLQPVKGRGRIIEAVAKGRASEAYRAIVRSFEWLDESTLLVTGQVRYALEAGGFNEGRVWWLDEFRGRRLRRVHGFKRESEARAEYAGRRDARTAAIQASRRY